MTREQWLRLLPLIGMLIITMLVAFGMFSDDSKKKRSHLEGMLIPSFEVPLIGSIHGVSSFSPNSWQGNVVVFNIFASWCMPCSVEHPALMELAKTGEVNIVGMGWKDTQENIVSYLSAHGNPYQMVGLDTTGQTTAKLGLSGVPETYVLDTVGRIIYSSKEPITSEEVQNVILPLVRKAQGK